MIWDDDRAGFGNLEKYAGRQVCAQRIITGYRSKPEMVLRSPESLQTQQDPHAMIPPPRGNPVDRAFPKLLLANRRAEFDGVVFDHAIGPSIRTTIGVGVEDVSCAIIVGCFWLSSSFRYRLLIYRSGSAT